MRLGTTQRLIAWNLGESWRAIISRFLGVSFPFSILNNGLIVKRADSLLEIFFSLQLCGEVQRKERPPPSPLSSPSPRSLLLLLFPWKGRKRDQECSRPSHTAQDGTRLPHSDACPENPLPKCKSLDNAPPQPAPGPYISHCEKVLPALACVTQFTEHCPMHREVTCSIPGQAHTPGLQALPPVGGMQPINVSLPLLSSLTSMKTYF